MAKPVMTGSINRNLVRSDLLFHGQKGVYLNIAIFVLDEPDKFGNTHVVYQSLSKEQREAGHKSQIIGNVKLMDEAPPQRHHSAQQSRRPPSQPPRPQSDPDLDAQPDDIPF